VVAAGSGQSESLYGIILANDIREVQVCVRRSVRGWLSSNESGQFVSFNRGTMKSGDLREVFSAKHRNPLNQPCLCKVFGWHNEFLPPGRLSSQDRWQNAWDTPQRTIEPQLAKMNELCSRIRPHFA